MIFCVVIHVTLCISCAVVSKDFSMYRNDTENTRLSTGYEQDWKLLFPGFRLDLVLYLFHYVVDFLLA